MTLGEKQPAFPESTLEEKHTTGDSASAGAEGCGGAWWRRGGGVGWGVGRGAGGGGGV